MEDEETYIQYKFEGVITVKSNESESRIAQAIGNALDDNVGFSEHIHLKEI